MSRITQIVGIALAGIVVALLLFQTGHVRYSGLVFPVMIALGIWIMRRPNAHDRNSTAERRVSQNAAYKSMLRMAWIYLAVVIVFLLTGGYKDLPVWVDVLGITVSVALFILWFSLAKKVKRTPPEEWKSKVQG
jgi:hypothetical protein